MGGATIPRTDYYCRLLNCFFLLRHRDCLPLPPLLAADFVSLACPLAVVLWLYFHVMPSVSPARRRRARVGMPELLLLHTRHRHRHRHQCPSLGPDHPQSSRAPEAARSPTGPRRPIGGGRWGLCSTNICPADRGGVVDGTTTRPRTTPPSFFASYAAETHRRHRRYWRHLHRLPCSLMNASLESTNIVDLLLLQALYLWLT